MDGEQNNQTVAVQHHDLLLPARAPRSPAEYAGPTKVAASSAPAPAVATGRCVLWLALRHPRLAVQSRLLGWQGLAPRFDPRGLRRSDRPACASREAALPQPPGPPPPRRAVRRARSSVRSRSSPSLPVDSIPAALTNPRPAVSSSVGDSVCGRQPDD